jgi:hypothetical protein
MGVSLRKEDAMRNARAFAAVIATTAFVYVPVACAQSAPKIANPDPAIQRTIAAQRGAIDDLVRRALNASAGTPDRVAAVNGLAGLYFDFLLANGEPLVKDTNADVAHVTVLNVAGQIAMLPGGHTGSHDHDPPVSASDEYQAQLVQESLRILRLGLNHSNEVVRNEAAAALTSRGDVQGLSRIQGLIEEGRMSSREGIRYLSLAPLQLAASYLEAYLSSPDVATKAAAIAPLSYDTRYTARVRTVALDANAGSAVLQAALPGLAVTDKDFASYGLPMAQNKSLSRETREVALESTIKFTMKTRPSEGVVRNLAALLDETALELNSDKAALALRDLKSAYRIQF